MKIAIDCSKAVNENAGIARYTWQLASNLPAMYPQDKYFYFFNFLRNKSAKQKLIDKLINKNKNVGYKIYPFPGSIKEKLFHSPFSILNYCIGQYDLYHATEFLSFDQNLKIPQVLTVHDLTMVKFPEHRGQSVSIRLSKISKLACQKADKIISVSEATKKDIIKYFNILPEKISVIPLGVQKKFTIINDKSKIKTILSKYKINYPFILFVGTIEPRKNISNLIKAFDKFAHTITGKKYHLVLIGRYGWNIDDIVKTHQTSNSFDKIHFLNYVADDELIYFYNGADVFCYPSLYEGFGLPIAEAMATGLPVITSNISSLPEVAGGAGILVDPYDFNKIAISLEQVLSNQSQANNMKLNSLKQAKKFSWEKCVRATHKLYEELVQENKT